MERYLPFAGMVMVECLDVGMTTLSKAAMSRGMSHFVFVVYSNALATLILLPPSFIIHRNKRPPLTFSILCKFFLLSLAGITIMQNCVFTGVSYSSPTLASAMSNLIPAFTFFLAVIFRMEKLDLRNSRSRIKIIGTLVSISGALVVTLYKGAPLLSKPVPDTSPSNTSSSTSMNNWIIGGLFLAAASSCVAIWNTAQAAILKGYPSEMTIVSFYSLFGTIQCTILSLFFERNPNAWTLRPDIELASIFYSAICGGVVTFSVQTWCIKKKGPVFVAMFKPLGIAIAATLGAIFLGEELHVGSLIGAVVIVVGFYGVIWAQSKEEKGLDIRTKEDDEFQEDDEVDRLQPLSQKKPLLESEAHV
ncbi:WAT1-related protein At3g28050-like [Argentina anserina]|uniref:WAT1-related protein At3g28050-like n=1 Tax=Argentina anserina TaxID=57926 RepID=UPI0021766935|nr:WAT1-related protein At3g28050-like [Potentilla anserina]